MSKRAVGIKRISEGRKVYERRFSEIDFSKLENDESNEKRREFENCEEKKCF